MQGWCRVEVISWYCHPSVIFRSSFGHPSVIFFAGWTILWKSLNHPKAILWTSFDHLLAVHSLFCGHPFVILLALFGNSMDNFWKSLVNWLFFSNPFNILLSSFGYPLVILSSSSGSRLNSFISPCYFDLGIPIIIVLIVYEYKVGSRSILVLLLLISLI